MARNLNMTEGKPLKLLFSFAVPLMFGNLFQQLYTVVDTAIVGNGVGMTALAALGSVDWLNWMLIGIAQGFSQGFSVRIAQKFGEKDIDGLRHALGHSAKLCAIIAIACLVIAQAGLPLFLKLLRVPGALAPIAKLYTRMIFCGLPVVMLYNFCAAALRAVGDSKTPLIAMICASIVNIILDCVAVFLLHWGVAGAAAATLIAQCISALVCILRMGHTPALRFQKRHLQADPQLDRVLLRIGTPVAVKNIIVSLGGMVISSIVNGFSLPFIAGFTATNKLYGLLEIAALSYGFAITTYIGQNYGALQYQRIRKGMRTGRTLCLVTSVVIGVLMLLFGRSITGLFLTADDPVTLQQASDTAYLYLCCMAVSLPVLYQLYAHQAALEGLGHTLPTMLSGILEFILRVSLGCVVGITGFEIGIFGAEVSAWYGAAIYLTVSYILYARKIIPKQ